MIVVAVLAVAPAMSAAQDQFPVPTTVSSAPAGNFAAQFGPYNSQPAPITAQPGSVDLSTFEAPREAQPAVRSLGTGIASYYGRRFHGRLTANGERFNMRALTAAHKTLPFGTRVRVTNPRNGRSVTVRINDRGPFIRGREIDLSRAAAERIGMISSGHARVELALVEG
ncbi:MAG: septal ring lytic transglycosylase RlpA family protein [Erythrobacter sp.]